MDPRTRSLTEYMRFRIEGWKDKGLSYEQIGKQKLNSTKVTANDLHKGKRAVGQELAARIAAIHHKGDYNAMYLEADTWAASPEGKRWLEERGAAPALAVDNGADFVLVSADGTVTLGQVKKLPVTAAISDDARALAATMAQRLGGAGEVPEIEWADFLTALDLACRRLRREVGPISPRARSVPPSSRGGEGPEAPPSSKAPGRSRPRMKAGARLIAKA